MPDPGTGLRNLAGRLRDAGTEGNGLRRALLAALTDAAQPVADKIASLPNLDEHLPDRYAAVLAGDLKVTVTRRLSGDPQVSVTARAVAKKRKVAILDQGFISHPVYAQGLRKSWRWSNRQTAGMKPGFFTGPAQEAAPAARDKVMKALADTARKIAG